MGMKWVSKQFLGFSAHFNKSEQEQEIIADILLSENFSYLI